MKIFDGVDDDGSEFRSESSTCNFCIILDRSCFGSLLGFPPFVDLWLCTNIGFSDLRTGQQFVQSRNNGQRQSLEKQKPQRSVSSVKEDRGPLVKKQASFMKPNRLTNPNARMVRQSEHSTEQKVSKEAKLHPRRLDMASVQKRQLGNQQDVSS